MLPDDAYLAELLRLSRDDDAVGPSWSPYVNRAWRIGELRVVVGSDGFDDLEITVEERTRRRGGWSTVGSARTVFDRQWRLDAGFDEPRAFLPTLLRTADRAGYENPTDDPAEPESTPDQVEAAWRDLVESLEVDGVVEEVDDGLLLTPAEGDPVHLHLDRTEWARYAVPIDITEDDEDDEPGEWGSAADGLHLQLELAVARGETHVVMFRGRPHTSTRAELPPVPGRAVDLDWRARAD